MQKIARTKFSAADDQVVDSKFANTPEMQAFNESMNRSKKQKKMLANAVFQLGRECPTYILQHLILSFGGSFILQDQLDDMEGDEAAAAYKTVTHCVMDRPL